MRVGGDWRGSHDMWSLCVREGGGMCVSLRKKTKLKTSDHMSPCHTVSHVTQCHMSHSVTVCHRRQGLLPLLLLLLLLLTRVLCGLSFPSVWTEEVT